MRSATLSGWAGFTFSNISSSFPCTEQALHQIVLGRNLPVICAAVFLHDLENLIPEPHRLVHVVDADIDERRWDRLLGVGGGGWWRGSPCGWSSPRTESSGQSTWRTAPEAGEIPLPHSRPSSATPRFPCRFLLPGAYFRHAARRTETHGALATPSTSGISSTSSFLPPGLPFSAFFLDSGFLPSRTGSRTASPACVIGFRRHFFTSFPKNKQPPCRLPLITLLISPFLHMRPRARSHGRDL